MFGGVNNTTGSLAGVFSLVSGDREFMRERGLRRRKKAGNVLQGVQQGAVSLVSGIAEGLAGVITQPLNGARSQGVKGFFKGMAKGLSGLVMKPVSGALDTISKTAEVGWGDVGNPEHGEGRAGAVDSVAAAEGVLLVGSGA